MVRPPDKPQIASWAIIRPQDGQPRRLRRRYPASVGAFDEVAPASSHFTSAWSSLASAHV